jgi:hypothetical protein
MPRSEMGYDVTREAIEALAAIDRRLWEVGPDWIDDAALLIRARQWLARTDQVMKGEMTAVVLALVLSLGGTATAQQAATVSGKVVDPKVNRRS